MGNNAYVRLVRENKTYRQFWLAAFISMFGEWFNTIALFLLILKYTDSELLLGILMAVRMGCFALMQPFFGLLADRVNRKKLMIITNILQMFLALVFIAVDGPEDMWWMFLCSGAMMAMHGLYVTAERAALPNIVRSEDLTTANALDSATWSTALCLGAFAGGLVVSEFGVNVAFVIDSVTFLIGTILLIPLTVPQTFDKASSGSIMSSGPSTAMKTSARNICSMLVIIINFFRLTRSARRPKNGCIRAKHPIRTAIRIPSKSSESVYLRIKRKSAMVLNHSPNIEMNAASQN